MSDDVLGRIRLFLEDVEKDGNKHKLDAGEMMVFADIRMLLALAQANMEKDGHKQFLDNANRAIEGWKRANTNQIDVIGRLQEELRRKNIDVRNLEEQILMHKREINALKDEAQLQEDWQNEVAELIPEDADGINPEGAQEGIILDYIKHLQHENARLDQELNELHDRVNRGPL